MESLGEMEVALQFYEMAQDYLSLVRVYCYCSNMDKVGIWYFSHFRALDFRKATNQHSMCQELDSFL